MANPASSSAMFFTGFSPISAHSVPLCFLWYFLHCPLVVCTDVIRRVRIERSGGESLALRRARGGCHTVSTDGIERTRIERRVGESLAFRKARGGCHIVSTDGIPRARIERSVGESLALRKARGWDHIVITDGIGRV